MLDVVLGRAPTLDLLGPGLTLITGPDRDGWEAAAGAIAGPGPVAVRSVDAISARALGVQGRGGLLVRPDGVPVGLWRRRRPPSRRPQRSRLYSYVP